VALKRRGRDLLGLCPFHNEKTPSFYVSTDKGFYHCFGCGENGDVIAYVMRTRRLRFHDAVVEILGLAVHKPLHPLPRREQEPMPADRTEQVDAILAACGPVEPGTAAYLYLTLRGLRQHQPALRAHQALYCHEVHGERPALIAPLTASSGEICAIQRIWCLPRIEFADGQGPVDSRAPLTIRKKTLGHMGDASVQLKPAGPVLGLAEGVETAIAASRLFRMPVWAVCGAARLGHVWVPRDIVTTLFIFGDNGETGHDLAERSVALWRNRGLNCTASYPNTAYGDFADELGDEPIRVGTLWA